MVKRDINSDEVVEKYDALISPAIVINSEVKNSGYSSSGARLRIY